MSRPDDPLDQGALEAVSSLVFWDHERKWDGIARYVLEGCGEPQFLFVLSLLIDPGRVCMGITLVVRRRHGRPPRIARDAGVHDLVRRLYFPDRERQALREIAACIRHGLQDRHLREDLSTMFDRTAEGPLGLKFDVRRTGKGTPRRARKLEAMNFLELHADVFEEKTSDVVAAAAVKFGFSECTALDYLKERRRRREPGDLEFDRMISYSMRDAGDPEYQPLDEIMKNIDL